MGTDDTVVGTLRGDLWQPLSDALAPLGLDKRSTLAVIEALADETTCPVLTPVAEPPPDHREVVQNPVTKQFYALRTPDKPVLSDLVLGSAGAMLAFTEQKAWGVVAGALAALLWFVRSGIVELDPLHALTLRGLKQGPRDGSRVSELAERLGWTETNTQTLLDEILERREGLLELKGDLWKCLV